MLLWLISVTLTLTSVFQCIHGAPANDEVLDLPGLSSQPPFKQYSGYLKGDKIGDKYLHYWFVESSSNPSTDPVVLWLNGGPGCSSVDGFLTEHGPFLVQPDGKSLRYNPYAWNQAANMIYLESPVGVGYSYANSKNIATNDSTVAIENSLALQDFFHKFPEYQENEFYITGESYGGVYVPTLAVQVLENTKINLKGFAVGNGLLDNMMNDNSIMYFVYYHGLIGDKDWEFLLSKCCDEKSDNPQRCNFSKSVNNPQCAAKLDHLRMIVWSSGLNVYNLYSECAGGINTGLSTVYNEKEGKFVTSHLGWPFSSLPSVKMERAKLKLIPSDKLRVAPPCINTTAAVSYMNWPDVRNALHIAPQAADWDVCSGPVGLKYKRIYNTMTPFYKTALKYDLRMMVYNGDVDMACNFLGSEWFVDNLGLTKPSKRKPWTYKAADGSKQIAGFVRQYDQMHLVTVKGAGHMVPSDKPIPALEMFINFLQNKPF